jgi:hypothetical protein
MNEQPDNGGFDHDDIDAGGFDDVSRNPEF